MAMIQKFNRLSFWSKIGVIGSVASIFAFIFYFIPAKDANNATKISQSAGNNSVQIGNVTGKVFVNSSSPQEKDTIQTISKLTDSMKQVTNKLENIELGIKEYRNTVQSENKYHESEILDKRSESVTSLQNAILDAENKRLEIKNTLDKFSLYNDLPNEIISQIEKLKNADIQLAQQIEKKTQEVDHEKEIINVQYDNKIIGRQTEKNINEGQSRKTQAPSIFRMDPYD
ncbi:hypothetical protein [Desulfobulbus propionicus]